MGRLDDIRKDITQMSLDELREHVRHLRADRKITKVTRGIKKTKARNSASSKTKVSKALDQMTPEQLEALLAEMEGNGDGPERDTTSPDQDTKG
jgi:ribosomal protein L29